MIDWMSIRATAKSLIADLTGAQVRWQDESEGAVWDGTPIIYLRASALGSDGIPEVLRQDNGALDQSVNVAAQKHFTLSLRAESFDQDLSVGHAGALLETLKTRLKRPSSIERLAGIFAIWQTLNTNRFTYRDAGREVSAYTLDLLCATADNDLDTTDGAGEFINEVQIQSNTIKGADGVDTLTQVNLDVKGT